MNSQNGAYGFVFSGMLSKLLNQAPGDWPVVHVAEERAQTDEIEEWLDEDNAEVTIGSTVGRVSRKPARIVFQSPDPINDVAHPYVTRAAGPLAYWLRRETFHAGAFVVDGRAWGVAALSMGGKSTILAGAAIRGFPVLADDLLVLDDGSAFAGPRSVDLRRAASEHLGVGEPIGVVGWRPRWRLQLPPVPPRVPMAGWIFPTWGHAVSVESVLPSRKLGWLVNKRAVWSPKIVDPTGLLQQASLPAFEFSRPMDWEAFEEGFSALIAAMRAVDRS